MHEWLSGGVSPCQGEGRGFESRLVLFLMQRKCEEIFSVSWICKEGIRYEQSECRKKSFHGDGFL